MNYHLPIWGDEQEAQRQDELMLQQSIEETLDRAKERPLTDDEIKLLAWASGITNYNTENRA